MSDERVKLLAEALHESDLIRRYDEYSRDAHSETMRRTPLDELARSWAAALLANPAFARLLELDEERLAEAAEDVRWDGARDPSDYWRGFNDGIDALYRRLAAHKEEARR